MEIKTFEDFILFARECEASDIHLTVGAPTVFRVHGELRKFSELRGEEDYSPVAINRMIHAMLNADQEEVINSGKDLDFSFELSTGARQRVNVFHQCGKLAATIRLLHTEIPSAEALRIPKVVQDLAKKKRGLILVTGPTGSGKTTTLASIIRLINENRACHVITIEDPIEYRYENAKATIHQREIGADVADFGSALRSALREDPDVIFVGEMRDYETISLAITAAETGHLVLATLHTTGAAETINRIIDVFPPHGQAQVRSQLSTILEAVISQTLIPTADHNGRVCAFDILLGTDAVKNLIRSEKTFQMDSIMQQSRKVGMTTFNDSIARLYDLDLISYEDAMANSNNKEELDKMLTKIQQNKLI
ncbi:MAG: type IV pilus twitching motility protein PilT [Oscillospiraceae bacterium]|nr:type IV pilus twitching motility protein PilT [Oscillospiraceae bacterium]